MRHLIVGNWKMHGLRADLAVIESIAAKLLPDIDILICPPATLIAEAARIAGGRIAIGGQDCHANPAGANTGDVAAALLAEAGATYVILGHSERREDHGETNADVAAKVATALAAGLVPIVCVGETESQRDAGEAEDVVRTQLRHSLPEIFSGLLAYEPVWAIGTGRTPTEAEVTAMHAAIRAELRIIFPAGGAAMPILYGGSVKPANAAALLALPEVGGALVGGASLNAADFLAIAAAAPQD